MLRNERKFASALAHVSPTIKFYALKTKRELEEDLPEMAHLVSDEQFMIDFNALLYKSRRDHELVYPISLAIAIFCFGLGLLMEKSMLWFVVITLYSFSTYFVVKYIVEQRIKLRNLNFFKRFISGDAVKTLRLEAEGKGDGSQA